MVGFNGTMVKTYLNHAGIDETTDIIDIPEDSVIPDIIQKMLGANTLTYSNELLRQALLLELLSELVSYRQADQNQIPTYSYPHKVYTEQAIHYITKEYMNDISVADIADRIGITRSYLAKCFNYTLDMSPKQFIIKYRMDKACDCLKQVIIILLKYRKQPATPTQLTFSKAFKTYFGISPNEWRNRNVDNNLPPK